MQSAGDDLISITVADVTAAQRLAAFLRQQGEWLEIVAGMESVVVRFDASLFTRNSVEARLNELMPRATGEAPNAQTAIEIPIVYGGEYGPDLERVCEQLGLTHDEFVEAHCGEYTVDMLGFTPGFAYIGGLGEALDVPRLREPRARNAAGSVGIADRRSGLYTLPGPGGWPVIGRTDAKLFDAASKIPFVLQPGMCVRFVAVDR